MGDLKGFSRRYVGSNSGYVVVVDDDGRVGYAYLINFDGRICADVWLYNRCGAPIEPEWNDPSKAPFANPIGYAMSEMLFPLTSLEKGVSIVWSSRGAKIVVDGLT